MRVEMLMEHVADAAGGASPYATAGGGVVLEHAYGGALLAELLLGGPVSGLGDQFTARSVKLQQSAFSPVDDLVVEGVGPAGERRLLIGVRRRPRIGASQRPFVKLMADYLRVVVDDDAELAADRWRLGLAVEAPHTPTAEVATLAYLARRQPGADAFRAAVNVRGATTTKVRRRLTKLGEVVAAAATLAGVPMPDDAVRDDLTWRLLRSLHILDLRLEGDDAVGRTSLVARLVPLAGDAAAADDLRRHLVELAAGYAVGAASVDAGMLRRDLSGRVRVAAAPALHASWDALQTLEESLRSRTRRELTAGRRDAADTARRLVVDRPEPHGQLLEAMRQVGSGAGTLAVRGEPGAGKSALSLEAVDRIRDDGGMVVALSLRDLPGSPIGAEQLLRAPARTVFAATAAAPTRLVLLDAAEVVQEGSAEVLRHLAMTARQAGLGVVAVTRDDARAAVLDALTPTPREAGGADAPELCAPAEVEVPLLTRGEAHQVSERFAELGRLAVDERSTWLLQRLGVVDVLLRGEATALLPDGSLCEADVFAAVWHSWVRRRDQTAPGQATPDGREQVMLQLARAELATDSQTGGAIAGGDPLALASLRTDGMLLPAGPRFAFRAGDEFAGDTVRDFALARLFLREGFEPVAAVGAPRQVLRAARLACQGLLVEAARTGGDRDATIRTRMDHLRNQFDAMAAEFGDRWADLPWEAALTAGCAELILEASAATLLDVASGTLGRVLRLVTQRFSTAGVADPVITGPVVAFLAAHTDQIRQADRRLAEHADELAAAWLRGVRRTVPADGSTAGTEAWRSLRAQLRDQILARDPTRLNDTEVECLALLGTDTDARVVAVLRRLAVEAPGVLAPCLEKLDSVLNLAVTDIDLLFELTEAYYIVKPDHDWASAPLDDGVRQHRFGPGVGVPFAAWHFGPFWLLLRLAPARALEMINKLLDHAATYRVQPEDTPTRGW